MTATTTLTLPLSLRRLSLLRSPVELWRGVAAATAAGRIRRRAARRVPKRARGKARKEEWEIRSEGERGVLAEAAAGEGRLDALSCCCWWVVVVMVVGISAGGEGGPPRRGAPWTMYVAPASGSLSVVPAAISYGRSRRKGHAPASPSTSPRPLRLLRRPTFHRRATARRAVRRSARRARALGHVVEDHFVIAEYGIDEPKRPSCRSCHTADSGFSGCNVS